MVLFFPPSATQTGCEMRSIFAPTLRLPLQSIHKYEWEAHSAFLPSLCLLVQSKQAIHGAEEITSADCVSPVVNILSVESVTSWL